MRAKREYHPPTFSPEQQQRIDQLIWSVHEAFKLHPWDEDPELSKPAIRRLCRRMCRQRALCGMNEEMIREAQRHFMVEGTDAFGKLALLP